GTKPSRRAKVSSSKVLSATRRRSCLGRAVLLKGQNRSPLPPARMSAYIESGMSLNFLSCRAKSRHPVELLQGVRSGVPRLHFAPLEMTNALSDKIAVSFSQ